MTEEKWSFYHSSRSHVHRSSCVATEMDRLEALMQKKIGQSILGKVSHSCSFFINSDDISGRKKDSNVLTHDCILSKLDTSHIDFLIMAVKKQHILKAVLLYLHILRQGLPGYVSTLFNIINFLSNCF